MRQIASLSVLMALPLMAVPLRGQQPVLVEGVTIVSPERVAPMSDASILIRDGRIVAIGPVGTVPFNEGTERIDGRGKWLVPGLIEFHAHGSGAATRSRGLALGVTTAQLIGGDGSPDPFEQRAALSDEPSPRIIRIQGGFGQSRGAPQSPEEGVAAIEQKRSEGARRLKIWHDDGLLWLPPERSYATIPLETLTAMVDRAHSLDMEIVVHAWKLELFQMALVAGVDRFIHPVADAPIPDESWALLRERRMPWTTTLTVFLAYADRDEYRRRIFADRRLMASSTAGALSTLVDPDYAARRYADWPVMRERREAYRAMVMENTRRALSEGLELVIGSDASMGVGTHLEIEQLAEAGLAPRLILEAATVNGARALGLADEIGTVEVGKIADLVLLNSDPLEDVRNLRDTFLILKGGHPHDPRALRGS